MEIIHKKRGLAEAVNRKARSVSKGKTSNRNDSNVKFSYQVTLYEIKVAVAAYLEKVIDDLTQQDVDLGLIALNHVRQVAEMNNDFNFTRKLLQVTVDGVTGGSLDMATEYGDVSLEPVTYQVKTIVDVRNVRYQW